MDVIPRLWVDFNEMFEDGSIDLRPNKADIDRLGELLQEGMKVILTDEEDHELEGQLTYNTRNKMWVAIPDWSTMRRPPGSEA